MATGDKRRTFYVDEATMLMCAPESGWLDQALRDGRPPARSDGGEFNMSKAGAASD